MPSPPRPPGIQSILDELAKGPAFDSLDALNRHLARRMQDYNTQPQAELGALSPDQVAQLLAGDWTSIGALRVARDASLDVLHDVPFLADARTLLHFVADHAPVKLTTVGNLSRAAVAALVPQLRMLHDDQEATHLPAWPIRNEGDVRWLTILRHVLHFAKLLVRRKGLHLSKVGRELLDDAQAGALYALLFRTFFQQFDLRFMSADDRHPGLQSTIAYSFYQLGQVGGEWTSAESLAERAWLESAREPMNARDLEFGDMRHYAFGLRVLEPLVMFGLLEGRPVPGAERWRYLTEYRRTALFARLLRFEFRGGGQRDVFLMR